MPDRSYYPDADNEIFIETSSDPSQIIRDSVLVASYRSAASTAGVPMSHTFNSDGQTLAFRSAEERQEVEDRLNGLSHVENFAGDYSATYIQAWQDVVPALMEKRGFPLSSIEYDADTRQVSIKFDSPAAKEAFAEMDAGSEFIDHALDRARLLERNAAGADVDLVSDQKITV